MWDFVMDKSGAGAGFLRELRFPLPIYIQAASPQSSSLSPEAGTIGLEWPQCQYPHKPNNNNKKTGWNLLRIMFISNLWYWRGRIFERYSLCCQRNSYLVLVET
jgi:hypothetical protein